MGNYRYDAEREVLENRGSRPGKEKTVITPDVIQSIHAFLNEEIEKKVKRKQRYTARKIYNILTGKIQRIRAAIRSCCKEITRIT